MNYLDCLRSDIKEARAEYERSKEEFDKRLKVLQIKIEKLEEDEEKVIERTQGNKRCSNCGEFVTYRWGESPHENSSGSGFGSTWSCQKRKTLW